MLRWLALTCLLSAGCALGGSTPPAYDPSARESLRIPGGQRCLALLDRLQIEHRRLRARGRMATPVEITGAIAGVRYTNAGKTWLLCDCRLALALHWAAPVLSAWRISEVEHYGAYADRGTRRGRPSLHALGLALDVAAFKFADSTQRVRRDYARDQGSGCAQDAPAVNRVVCQLRGLGLFRELITPDHDADHHDHVHLGILPL